MALNDFHSVMCAIRIAEPDEIYNLGAQSHVRVSFDQPNYTAQTVAIGTLNVLEAAHKAGLGHVLSIHQPDSGAPPQQAHRFRAITDFRELLPIS